MAYPTRIKSAIFAFLSFLFIFQARGQRENSYFINEFSLSVNRTMLYDDNTENRFGFGGGVYGTFLAKKKINILTGMEYNMTSQFKNEMYEGHYAYSTNVTYFLANISLPVTARINVGKKIKFFVEAGAFIDMCVGSRREGTMHTYHMEDNYHFVYTEHTFSGGGDCATFNYGPSCGIGLKIPVSKHELLFKTDYKCGLYVLYDYLDQIENRYLRIMVGFII
jgi:hypothetical protein